MPPFIGDVESFELLDRQAATSRSCSRTENAELFRLVIGGYGLFGIVVSATLRLVAAPQGRARGRDRARSTALMRGVRRRIRDGYLYGDFQYAIDPTPRTTSCAAACSTCYRAGDPAHPDPRHQRELRESDWSGCSPRASRQGRGLPALRRRTTSQTNGQVYWSDLHQLSTYLDDYHRGARQRLASQVNAAPR